MNRSKIIEKIFKRILSNGVISSKGDILSDDPIEDKVYTKRININKEYEFKNCVDTIDVVSVCITSDNENIKDANTSNVRINFKNRAGSWVNIFIYEAPDELLEFIYNCIK